MGGKCPGGEGKCPVTALHSRFTAAVYTTIFSWTAVATAQVITSHDKN